MKNILLLSTLLNLTFTQAQYAPPAGQVGTTAIHKDSSTIISWATKIETFNRGYLDISNPNAGLVTFGDSTEALSLAEGTSGDIVSLGDGGSITLGFAHPIKNGPGHDFAVFENSFSDNFLELAHIEVSTNGIRFVRLPSISLTPTTTQTNSFGATEATNIYNLAGKYRQGFGTPFDLEDIIDSTGINLDSINYVRVIDVVGTITTGFSTDSQGHKINDPYPTSFPSGGFDLDAIAVINENTFLGHNENKKNTYSIYPNPSNGALNITTISDCDIDIISINGQLIHHSKLLKNETLYLNDLKSGLYLIYFKNSKNTSIKKVIVNQ
jgi:hypothetical protein